MNLLNDLFQNSLSKKYTSLSIMAIDDFSKAPSQPNYFPRREQTVKIKIADTLVSQHHQKQSILTIVDPKNITDQAQTDYYKKYMMRYSKIEKIVAILANKLRKINYHFFIKLENIKANIIPTPFQIQQIPKKPLKQLNSLKTAQLLQIKLSQIINLMNNSLLRSKSDFFQKIKTKYNKQLKIQYHMLRISILMVKKVKQIKRQCFDIVQNIIRYKRNSQYIIDKNNYCQAKQEIKIKIKDPLICNLNRNSRNIKIHIKEEIGIYNQLSIELMPYRNIPIFPQRTQLELQDWHSTIFIQSQSEINQSYFTSFPFINNKSNLTICSISIPPSPPKAHRSNITQQTIQLRRSLPDEIINFNLISNSVKRRISDLTSMTGQGYCSKQDEKQILSEKLHLSKSDHFNEEYQLPRFRQFYEDQDYQQVVQPNFKKKGCNQQINNEQQQNKGLKYQNNQISYLNPLIHHSRNSLKDSHQIQNLVAYKKSITARKSITMNQINKNKEAIREIVGELRKSKEKEKNIQKSSKNKIVLKKNPKNQKDFQKRLSLKNSQLKNLRDSKQRQKLSLSKKGTPQKMSKSRSKAKQRENKEIRTQSPLHRYAQSQNSETDQLNSHNAQLYYKYLKLKNKNTCEYKGNRFETPEKNKQKSFNLHLQEYIPKQQNPNKTILNLSKHPLKFKKLDLKIQLKNKISNTNKKSNGQIK